MKRWLLVVLLVLAGCSGPPTSRPSLVAFHARWCITCQRDRPLLKDIANEFPVTQVDFEAQRSIAARYHVCYLPTYVVLSDGEEVMRSMNLSNALQALRLYDQ